MCRIGLLNLLLAFQLAFLLAFQFFIVKYLFESLLTASVLQYPCFFFSQRLGPSHCEGFFVLKCQHLGILSYLFTDKKAVMILWFHTLCFDVSFLTFMCSHHLYCPDSCSILSHPQWSLVAILSQDDLLMSTITSALSNLHASSWLSWPGSNFCDQMSIAFL